jgi:MFS family permease
MMSQTAWSQFLPVIIKQNGYSTTQTQIMTIPVYVAAGVAAIAIGYLSDRCRSRGLFVIGSFSVTAAGWLILILSKDKNLSYAGTFLIAMGSTPSVILEMAWLNNNIIGYTKKYVYAPAVYHPNGSRN